MLRTRLLAGRAGPRWPGLFAGIALASSLATAGVSAADLAGADEAAIRSLEARSWAAWQARDGAFFADFLSDDHVEVHAYGVVGKAAVVSGVRSPACVVRSYSLGPLSLLALAPEVVLVSYRAEQDSVCGEAKVPSPVWATSLYVKRSGRWLNALYQHTPTTQPAPAR